MDALVLMFRDEPIRQFHLGTRPLEIGSDPRCDIVVHDAELPGRKLLVMRAGARVIAHDVSTSSGRTEQTLHLDVPIALGRHHAIVRTAVVPIRLAQGTPLTDIVAPRPLDSSGFALVVGEGHSARRALVRNRPVFVGTQEGNDLVIADRTVSGRHLRLDPQADGLSVRDLGSRNGTWVDGVRVEAAKVGAGARIRVGRTTLTVVSAQTHASPGPNGLVAASRQMQSLLADVDRLARLAWPVLIQGPSGAGKEGVARALHDQSPRAAGPFVALNAGGLPAQLVESELFGHEKGAFTGAAGQRRGVFEQADHGTLFLDEIGELPFELQARLLRVLETWQVRRVGAEACVSVDVRLVCATHRDLRAMVTRGEFREDLYYRLARLVVAVPALADRPDDVEALAHHFLAAIRDDVGDKRLSGEAVARLLTHPWPGNARELRNVVCAAAAATASGTIQSVDVERAIERVAGPLMRPSANDALAGVMAKHGNNLSAVARALGVPRTTLRDRVKGVTKTRQRRTVRELRAVGADDAE